MEWEYYVKAACAQSWYFELAGVWLSVVLFKWFVFLNTIYTFNVTLAIRHEWSTAPTRRRLQVNSFCSPCAATRRGTGCRSRSSLRKGDTASGWVRSDAYRRGWCQRNAARWRHGWAASRYRRTTPAELPGGIFCVPACGGDSVLVARAIAWCYPGAQFDLDAQIKPTRCCQRQYVGEEQRALSIDKPLRLLADSQVVLFDAHVAHARQHRVRLHTPSTRSADSDNT